MSDVALKHTPDGGEITVIGGEIELSGGLFNLVYLSIFGGNFEDKGGTDDRLEYWGNKLATSTSGKYRSETQYLLNSLPFSTGNIARIEDAILRDTEPIVSSGVADEISSSVSITGVNRVEISVDIERDLSTDNFKFLANWQAKS